jgi:hypothetical protein
MLQEIRLKTGLLYKRARMGKPRSDDQGVEGLFTKGGEIEPPLVIGSRGSVFIPPARRKKMQEKTRPCRLLGYQGSRNYILLSDGDQVFITKNVIFDETN